LEHTKSIAEEVSGTIVIDPTLKGESLIFKEIEATTHKTSALVPENLDVKNKNDPIPISIETEVKNKENTKTSDTSEIRDKDMSDPALDNSYTTEEINDALFEAGYSLEEIEEIVASRSLGMDISPLDSTSSENDIELL
jgi:hypothetical protein